MKRYFKFTSLLALFYSFTQLAFAEEAYMCIWRNPERTMERIFPNAQDYQTITKQISSKSLQQIEDKAGKLLAGQREAFQYYELKGNSKSLGHILASTQKGEYGAIEFVFGIDKDKKITGIYIQRSRERDREFRKKEFLNQFIGKGLNDLETINFNSTVGTKAVMSGLKKELTAFEVLK